MTKETKTIKELKKVNHKLKHQYDLLQIRHCALNSSYQRLKEMKLHTEKYASEMEDKYILEKYKNNKAIEYMERYMFSQKENYDYIHLSDILKGVDKNV